MSSNQLTQARGWRDLVRAIHEDRRGAVSIETILIIAAIALPILIFVLKFGWPKFKAFFNQGMTDLEGNANQAASSP